MSIEPGSAFLAGRQPDVAKHAELLIGLREKELALDWPLFGVTSGPFPAPQLP